MKKILLFITLLSIATIAMGQIKVLTNGKVGIGTNSVNWETKLQIADGGNNIAIAPNAGGTNIGAYIAGGGTPRLDFWHSDAGWNNVRMKAWTLSSDSTVKTDIRQIENATAILKKIKTYSYFFASDSIEGGKKDYGVLAQELEEILPELVDTAKGTMFVNYNAFIGILMAGFNEQQAVIEKQQHAIEQWQAVSLSQEKELLALQSAIMDLQYWIFDCCETPKGSSQIPIKPENPELNNKEESQTKAILHQNAPNPFSVNTEIRFEIPVKATSAKLLIHDMQGAELRSYDITKKGMDSIIIQGSELSAGMYLYTLVVNNEIIDTKRMILTK